MAGVVVDVIVIIVVVCSFTNGLHRVASGLGRVTCVHLYYWTLNVGHFITEDSAVHKLNITFLSSE